MAEVGCPRPPARDPPMTRESDVADGLATALLAGPWTRRDMLLRTRTAIGRARPPKWLPELLDEVLAAYRDAPVDRPRELAAYLELTTAWPKAWASRRPPRIVQLTPVPTAMGRTPWPITALPDLGALARLLDLDHDELDWFADLRGLERSVDEPLRHYRWTAVPKGDGDVRVLGAPKPRLKEIQRRLLRHLLLPIPVHAAAHGSVRGRSVRTAVTPHAGASTVIRADIESFFHSIPAGRVRGLLESAGLPEAVAHTATGLMTTVVPHAVWRAHLRPGGERSQRWLAAPHLPQGAPTSPALGNLIGFTLDRRLDGLAESFGARYTRYVDDLVFSGGSSLHRARSRFVALVAEIVAGEGFRLNDRKTVVLGSAGRQALLGAVINDRPTVSRAERDALRALLHNCARSGWRSQARDRANFPEYVLGRVSWVQGLDPAFGARLRAAYDRIDWT
jgi:RNA-directed DNA polymerase